MERYREIIDNWREFKQASDRPAVSTIRRNRIKADKGFERRLREDFQEVEQADWNSNIYRLPETEKPGKSMMHWLGEYYVQEESATVPVEVLNPRPGDSVMDMAAAPGGKTTQIASKINNEGNVLANDVSGNRMKSLHANVYRTGAASVTATNYDARHITEDTKYDKVLLDAPCSGEGDRFRRDFTAAGEEEQKELSNLQKQLIEKAAGLLKKGGEAVYSTCTVTPTENEKVVQYAVDNTELELQNIEADVDHVRGVESFNGERLGKQMDKTVRIYPHHLNSGVIYIAKFRK